MTNAPSTTSKPLLANRGSSHCCEDALGHRQHHEPAGVPAEGIPIMNVNWNQESARDEKLLGRLDLDLLDHDVVARGEDTARTVGDHNGRLADLTYRFNELVFYRRRLTDFSAWSDSKLDDLLAERARLVRESWEWLQNLRAALVEREDILKKAEEAIKALLDELNQRRERTVARLSKSMAGARRECLAVNPYRGDMHFGELVESDDAVVAIDRRRADLQSDLEWVADHRRRAMGGQSDVLARQQEVLKHLMN